MSTICTLRSARLNPSFIPAFDGSLIEFQYFSPNLDDVRDNEVWDTDEDRQFVPAYTEMIGDAALYPWIMQPWDHGGYVRFGDYRWADAVTSLDTLRANTKGQAYRAMVDGLEEALRSYGRRSACRGSRVSRPITRQS